MSPDGQSSEGSVSEAIARQRITELERALAVSERCLISVSKTLKELGCSQSAAQAGDLIGMIHNILHNKPRNRLH